MRPTSLDIDLSNVDADGLADNNDSSGTSVTLDGALTSGGTFSSADGLGRIITITDASTSDQSDVTFTVTGTDSNGDSISDAITGPGSGATVASSKYFKTVSSVTISAAQGGSETVDIGTRNTTSVASSSVVPLNFRDEVPAEIAVTVTGTINYTVQETFDDILANSDASGNITWSAIGAFSSKTASVTSKVSVGSRAVRVLVNSYTDTAELSVSIVPVNNDAPAFELGYLDGVTSNIQTQLDAKEATLSGASLTSATVATGDKVLAQDVDDSDNLKTVTAQSIADLASGGGLILINSQTASNDTEIVFNNTHLTSTYDNYMLQIDDLVPVSDASVLRLQVSIDNGSAYLAATNYNFFSLFGIDSGTTITGSNSGGTTNFPLATDCGTGTGENVSVTLRMHNINSSLYKVMNAEVAQYNSNAVAQFRTGACAITTTSAINNIRVYMSSGNISSGTFKLYGIVKS